MTLSLTTPGLLFPAISLLLLAYTNRFLVLAQLIRQLHGNNRDQVHDIVLRQIKNLRRRILLTKVMQALGVLSFILCAASMFWIFYGYPLLGEWFFGASLISLTGSLLVSLYEILISTQAIEMELEDMSPK